MSERGADERAIELLDPSADVLRWSQAEPTSHRKLLVAACKQRGLEVERLGTGLTASRNGRVVAAFTKMLPHSTSAFAERVCSSKHRTLRLLRSAKVPVPEGGVFSLEQRVLASECASQLGWPVVLKPSNQRGGQGVVLGIESSQMFRSAWDTTASVMSGSAQERVLVEREYDALDLRTYVVGGEVAAAALRVPAHVRGDGRATIAELVDQKNRDRARHPYLHRLPITIDQGVLGDLAAQDLTPASVPRKHQLVLLRRARNISLGGENVDITHRLPPRFASIAVRAVDAIPGLDIAGVDMLASGLEWTGDVRVLEVNTSANLCMHHFPVAGQEHDVAGAIVDRLLEQDL